MNAQAEVLANLIKAELQARGFLSTEPNQIFIECVASGVVRYLENRPQKQERV
ncbi:hypothetical protein [Helicobacter sp. L8]|uniref:hypothetical protein n=1 Tax=Helicobacter sp. L8 TaxID=2316078 RepID=UPI0013CE1ADA|nr:hypothetical protein [Helicobacter sp. L8]